MASVQEPQQSDRPDWAAFFPRSKHSLLETAPDTGPWDTDLTGAVNRYQESIGSNASVAGNEAVIATGQQPAVFGGPLYTVYKAITAINLANTLAERHGVRCTPLFWLAGDDHDFEEARSVGILSKDDHLLTLRYDPETNPNDAPLHSTPAGPHLHELIDLAADATRGSEHRESIRADLHESVDASSSLCDWSARILARLFADSPIPIFVPHLPEARSVAAAVVQREIEEPLASTRLLNEGGARLEAAGLTAQVVKKEAECNFFLECEGARRKITYEDGRFIVHGESEIYTIDEMLTLLREAPDRFSPNVALRPIVQQHLFPVAAYVAGPGELAYWAQLRGVFDHFGKPMPVVYPRTEAVLFTAKHRKLLRKHGLQVNDLFRGADELIDGVLAHSDGSPALKAFQSGRQKVMAAVDGMTDEIAATTNVAGQLPQTRERIRDELDRMERALLHADGERVSTIKKQVQRLCHVLAPDRKPQERVYSIFSFLFEYGWGLIPRLVRDLDPQDQSVQEIEL